MNADRLNGLSERIHKCSFTLANMLGCGLLEKELRNAGLAVAQQRGIVSPTMMSVSEGTPLTYWSRSRFSWN